MIKDGIFQQFGWDRGYKVDEQWKDTHLAQAGGFRMQVRGETTAVEHMIATTKRGVLVTRFDHVQQLDERSRLQRGYTRDGLWLIENGKISKAAKNLAFTESPVFALNNVEQIGVPQRVFRPKDGLSLQSLPKPVIVPALKVKDFSFTALSDAV